MRSASSTAEYIAPDSTMSTITGRSFACLNERWFRLIAHTRYATSAARYTEPPSQCGSQAGRARGGDAPVQIAFVANVMEKKAVIQRPRRIANIGALGTTLSKE